MRGPEVGCDSNEYGEERLKLGIHIGAFGLGVGKTWIDPFSETEGGPYSGKQRVCIAGARQYISGAEIFCPKCE